MTRDQLDIDYGYKRFLNERWFGAGNAEYFQDTLKEIDSRITLGAGVGVQFIDNSIQNLASDLGISAVRKLSVVTARLNPLYVWASTTSGSCWQKRLSCSIDSRYCSYWEMRKARYSHLPPAFAMRITIV